MKTCLAMVSMLTFLAATAVRAQTQTDDPTKPKDPVVRMQVHDNTQLKVHKGSEFVGSPVENRQGEKLGKIEELALDVHQGKIAYAVLSFGGFLGLGDKLFAIPWSAMSLKPDNKGNERIFVLDVSKDRLKSAPGFDKNAWPDMANPTWGGDIDRYWQTESTRNMPRSDTGMTDAGRAKTPAEVASVKRIRKLKAELLSRDVKDAAMKDLGDVQEIMIDCNSGRVAFVIVQFDDVSRIPDEANLKTSDSLFAIPWQALALKPDAAQGTHDTFVLNIPDAKLRTMPRFAEDRWPNMSDLAWNNQVIQYYGTRPYWEESIRSRTVGRGGVEEDEDDRDQP